MMNRLTLADVKQKQFMLIMKAGLSVCQFKEKSKQELQELVLEEFIQSLAGVNLPQQFDGFDKKSFLRTKNFHYTEAQLKPDDIHTGPSLWRKFKEIRLVIMNDITPLLSKKMPGGMIPSGKSFAELLLAVRQELYGIAEEKARKNSKSQKPYKSLPFTDQWYPVEWDAFVTFGAGSPTPDSFLSAM